jgi:hypothetical protein
VRAEDWIPYRALLERGYRGEMTMPIYWFVVASGFAFIGLLWLAYILYAVGYWKGVRVAMRIPPPGRKPAPRAAPVRADSVPSQPVVPQRRRY